MFLTRKQQATIGDLAARAVVVYRDANPAPYDADRPWLLLVYNRVIARYPTEEEASPHAETARKAIRILPAVIEVFAAQPPDPTA
jgi:hypothetical protein